MLGRSIIIPIFLIAVKEWTESAFTKMMDIAIESCTEFTLSIFEYGLILLLNRVGLVFVVDNSEDVDGLQDAGVALLRAYNYVAQEVDTNYAFQTIISVSNMSHMNINIFQILWPLVVIMRRELFLWYY